jgi:hypothetical protein
MAVLQSGVTTDLATIDPSFKALRASPRPLDHDALGHYSIGLFTGILPAALGANSEIFQFRWANGGNLAVIRKVVIAAAVTTTFFAAGVPVQIDLVKASGWTVAGTGGTAIVPAAQLRKRSNMANSLVVSGDMRIATTAALGVGTKTLETNSLATLLAAGPITASLDGLIIQPGTVLFENNVGDGEHPLVLNTNDGFVVRSVAVPATGTWQVSIIVDWAEVAAY